MRHIFLRHKLIFLVCFVVVVVVGWLFGRVLPASEDDIRRSACLVEGHRTLCLVDGKDTLMLHTDTVSQQGVWINKHWWWPSCNGRVLTLCHDSIPFPPSLLANADSVFSFVIARNDSLQHLLARKETERKELIYYLRSHGVIDEGYTQIAAYAQKQSRETDSLKRLTAKLQAWIARNDAAVPNTKSPNQKVQSSKFKVQSSKPKAQSHWRLMLKHDYRVTWFDNDDSLRSVGCKTLLTRIGNSPMIIHTKRSTKPWGVYAVRNVMWGAPSHKKIITVTLSPSAPKGRGTILTTGNYDRRTGHDLPHLFAVDGSPVFTEHGRFIGIIAGKEVIQ